MKNQIVVRESNIELLRIIAMFLIVCSHSTFSVHEHLVDHRDSLNTLFQYFISWGGKTGINIFMLITGYFMCISSISLYKFIKLVAQILFYSIFIGVLLLMLGLSSPSIKNIIEIVFPFSVNDINNFCTSFLFFYLLIPFLTISVNVISKRMHTYLLVLFYFSFVLWNDFPLFDVTIGAVGWYSILFLIASYIRKYVDINKYHKTAFITLVSSIIINYVLIYILWRYTNLYPIGLIAGANTHLALIISISAFIWFKGLTIEFYPIINKVAASTFGILLIHSGSSAIRDVVWSKIIPGSLWFKESIYPIYMIFSIVLLFIVCSCIEILRLKYLDKIT